MAIETMGQDELKLSNLLPPLFLTCSIGTIWSIYCCLHLYPMLQIGVPPQFKDYHLSNRGANEAIIAQILLYMLMACYTRAMLTNPGTIPDSIEWRLGNTGTENHVIGDRRHCKWCLKYKPERTHHCRICKRCILKMDHHCPWIMNCVGFGNHKFFFLVVMYSAMTTSYISWTVYDTVVGCAHVDMPHINRFFLVLCFFLSSFFAVLMTAFWLFHVRLMLMAMTTIESCEERTGMRKGSKAKRPHDLGLYGNISVVLGPRPLLWFLPIDLDRGDGVGANPFNRGGSNPQGLATSADALTVPALKVTTA